MSSVVSAFENASLDYLKYAHIQKYAAASLARWLPESIKGRVLELGAGPGVFTHYLAPWKNNVFATDASEAMCRLGKMHFPSVTWKCSNANAPLEGPWEMLCSSSMLQWITEPLVMLSHWKSVLAPKGRILCSLFVEGTLIEWESISGLSPPLTWRSPLEWNLILMKSGFKVQRQEIEKKEIFSPNALESLKSIHKLGASPKPQLGAGHLRSLMMDYERKFSTPSGVSSTWVIYRFEAVID
jgi:SAM-dependent methyltransferase